MTAIINLPFTSFSMTFHDRPKNSMNFQAWKMKFVKSTTRMNLELLLTAAIVAGGGRWGGLRFLVLTQKLCKSRGSDVHRLAEGANFGLFLVSLMVFWAKRNHTLYIAVKVSFRLARRNTCI